MSDGKRERPGCLLVKVSQILMPLPPSCAAPSYWSIRNNWTRLGTYYITKIEFIWIYTTLLIQAKKKKKMKTEAVDLN